MKVTLIRPPVVTKLNNKAHIPTPPLGLALIAAVLEQNGHNVNIIDSIDGAINKFSWVCDDIYSWGLSNPGIISKIPPDTQVIGVSCMFTVDWICLRNLIHDIGVAFPEAIIVTGGEHITALPGLCMEECPEIDICVLGEGEDTIVELFVVLEEGLSYEQLDGIAYRNLSGQVIIGKKRERKRNISDLPFPAWHLFPVHYYFEHSLNFGVGNNLTLPLLATRGCPYRCTFCSSPDMWGTRYFMRDVKNVVDEMEYLHKTYKVKNIDLYDLTAIINSHWIIELCREIRKRKLLMTWQLPSGTRSEAITTEVLNEMKLSGCCIVSYAPESGSPKILDSIQKRVNLKKMLIAIKETQKIGIFVKVNIILGFPEENHSDIWKTLLFILKCSWNGAHDMGPNPFYPIPGTRLFSSLLAQKK